MDHYVSIVHKPDGKKLNPLEIVKKLDFTVLFALIITCAQKSKYRMNHLLMSFRIRSVEQIISEKSTLQLVRTEFYFINWKS